jgi:hypothetical protein
VGSNPTQSIFIVLVKHGIRISTFLVNVGQNPVWKLLMAANLIFQMIELRLGMALGEKLFEESGNVTGFKVTKVHPIEGVTMEVSFTSEIRGIGRFPSGKNLGSGTITHYRLGIVDQSNLGSMMTTTAEGSSDQFMWWLMERAKWLKAERSKG